MADYMYSVAIKANSFHNNNKLRQIKRFGGLTGGGLTNIHCIYKGSIEKVGLFCCCNEKFVVQCFVAV